MGWQSCEKHPQNRPIRNSQGGPLELKSKEIYDVLVDMINPPNPSSKPSGSITKNVPGIHLFDISKSLSQADITARRFCDTEGACPDTGRSKFANCKKMQKDHNTLEALTPIQEIVDKLVKEQEAQAGGSFAGLYGKYTLTQADCGTAKAGFGPEDDKVDGSSCRLKAVVPVNTTDGYWKTTWRNKDNNDNNATESARIVVTYAASRDLDLQRRYSELVTAHGMGGDERGWQWADAYGNMDLNVVVRSTLNGLRVKNMMLSKANSSDNYMLCGAHRLNFAYHKVSRDKISANTGWGESTYANDTLLSKMNANGLATKSLFDPLGLVWLLLWKKEKLSAFDAKDDSYYMCAAHMHPHFADMITGILPERYDVCTATRWWNTGEHSNEWFMAKKNPMNHTVEQIKLQMGTGDDWVDWVSDKIRKPFFKIKNYGSDIKVENRGDIEYAILAEAKRPSITKPLATLIAILKNVYFDIPIETPTPKPQDTEKPGTNGTNGTEVTTVTTGNHGAAVTTGANDPAVITDPTNKPQADKTDKTDKTDEADEADKTDKTDDASKGTGTGTPVPTGTGTPAKEESFWDKNQYYIIGGIVGGLVLLIIAIFAFIVVSSRNSREASYQQLVYSDPGYPGYIESPGEGPEGLGEGPEGLEPEGLGGEGPEGLGGEETDPTRFGF
jgi:hypothetical protein